MTATPTTASTTRTEQPTAVWVARFLKDNGVRRVFGLQGGHIQPIWDQLARLGVEIIDVRHEAAAVHMAHAHAELTGELGVALATAGPGVTNTVTSIANAFISRDPVLMLGGCPPSAQANMGALQDIPHTAIMEPITRRARTLREAGQVLRELNEACSLALGVGGDPGPVYIEIPTDVLRTEVPATLALDDYLRPIRTPRSAPIDEEVATAAELIRAAARPLVITGRGARALGPAVTALLDASGAAYLDTQESRGLVPESHPAVVGAVRGKAMSECDLLITIGRRLDYQLGYGSPAAFPHARLLRISDTSAELIDNRRGDVELLCSVDLALSALTDAMNAAPARTDRSWRNDLRRTHEERSQRHLESLASAPDGADGYMHPNRIFAAVHESGLTPAVTIADGGDFLSFARLAAPGDRYLDPGPFGCLGVGVPFAIAAACEYPGEVIMTFTGDGAYGINAMEINTAARHDARIVVIVADNRAWNIERYDQETNYGLVAGTDLGKADYAEMAVALGAHGERVRDPADLVPALKRAIANAPAVIHVDVTRDAVSPDATKGLGFVPEYQALIPWNDAEVARRAGN